MLAFALLTIPVTALVCFLAYRTRALTVDGAGAALVVGTLIVTASLAWAGLLLVFFVSSSLLSRLSSAADDAIVGKPGSRDSFQVLANGGIPALCAFISLIHGSDVLAGIYSSALAVATADTWASEIGRQSRSLPRDLVTGRVVAAGTSGGITYLGLAAAFSGALSIGAAAWLLRQVSPAAALAIAGIGWMGALLDSLLGATIQHVRCCPACGRRTEQRVHAPCGAHTLHASGLRWMNNDAVNLLSAACGTALAFAVFFLG